MSNKTLFILFGCLLLLQCSRTPAIAETFFLTATGSGSKDGGRLENAMSPNEFNLNLDVSADKHSKIKPGDTVLIYDDHGSIQIPLFISSPFETEEPIILKAGEGERPIIDGSMEAKDLVWVKEDQYGDDIWSHSFGLEKSDIFGLWYNKTIWGLEKSRPSDCTAKGEWYYDAALKKLYLYSVNHPSSYYKSVRISNLDRGIDINAFKGKVQIENLHFQYFARMGNVFGPIVCRWAKYVDVSDCTFEYYPNGIVIVGNMGGAYRIDSNKFRFPYSNKPDGRDQSAVRTQCRNTIVSNNLIDGLTNVGGKYQKIGGGINLYHGSAGNDELPANCKFRNNLIKNSGWMGITCFEAGHVDGDAYDINLTIANNLITGGQYLKGDYDGIGIEGNPTNMDAVWKNILIYNNRIYQFGNAGIDLADSMGKDSLIFGNIISNSGGKGWGGIRVNGGADVYNNTIYNVYDTEPDKDWSAGIWISQNGTIASNNIIHTVTCGKGIALTRGVTAKGSNNLFYHIYENRWFDDDFEAMNYFLADPLMKAPENGEFSLLPNSPAKNNGAILSLDQKFNAVTTYADAKITPDIGAIPYPIIIPPPTIKLETQNETP